MNPYKDKDFRSFIESIPSEEIERQSRLEEEENQKQYKEFTDALKVGKCFICGDQMDKFDERKPCFHWFTYPNGIKKKHFEAYLKEPVSFYRLDAYFRWLANSEILFGNINDLKEELSKTSYLETTIKYKNVEWSFSVGYTDKDGHPGAKVGAAPHYHLQMIVDGRIFLKFNDFHISYTDEDLFNITMAEQVPDLVEFSASYGSGIGVIENEDSLETVDEAMQITDDIQSATFNRQTMISAGEGETISGDMIWLAIEESKRTKEPVGRIMQRLLGEANSKVSITVMLSPGEGVPELKKRSGKK